MNDNDFSNIDDILAEFSSFSSEFVNQEQQPAEPETEKVTEPEFPEKISAEQDVKAYVPRHQADTVPKRPRVPETGVMQPYVPRTPAPAAPVRRSAAAPAERADAPAARSAAERPAPLSEGTRIMPRQAPPRRPASAEFDPAMLGYANAPVSDKTQISPVQRPARRQSRPEKPQPRRAQAPVQESPRRRAAEESGSPAPKKRPLLAIIGTVCMVLSLLILNWVFLNVHPDSGTITTSTARPRMNLMEKFDNYVNNTASYSLDGLVYIPKIYTIPEEATVAPKPNPALFGSSTDPQEIMKVIESAANLLDGQEVVFNPEANFVPGSPIQYYLDDTILAITWQEDIDNKLCSCSEVKVAHGSQIRRKLADDTFNSGRQYYASDMAKQSNAIVAVNGDFYANRTIGISAYNRELYRFTANDRLESCAFTASGDMLFIHAGELYDEEYTKQYMEENDVVFLISFGPILIEDGELCDLSSGYPIGEINHTYSRTGIAQMGPLHYFTMNINYGTGSNGKGYGTAATLAELGRFMYDKGCHHAYTLDGGQTSVLLMNGELVNHVDYGYERLMSDIIYFATAIPEEEAAQ